MDNPPRYVFHHLPKCGGNSVKQTLLRWFVPVEDYAHKGPIPADNETAEDFADRRLDLDRIDWAGPPRRLLVGHFELAGCRLFERYPETAAPPYRRFTFLRDPLDRALSYFHFAKRTGRFPLDCDRLEDFLRSVENPLARLLASRAEDALDTLERYWFVGTLDRIDADMARLAEWLGLPTPERVLHVNRTPRRGEAISEDTLAHFRSANAIDRTLYEWARNQAGTASSPICQKPTSRRVASLKVR